MKIWRIDGVNSQQTDSNFLINIYNKHLTFKQLKIDSLS